MADMKAMTLRLPAEVAEDLALVAGCFGETVSDAVRMACVDWINARRADPHFRTLLAQHIDRAKRLLAAGQEGGQS